MLWKHSIAWNGRSCCTNVQQLLRVVQSLFIKEKGVKSREKVWMMPPMKNFMDMEA